MQKLIYTLKNNMDYIKLIIGAIVVGIILYFYFSYKNVKEQNIIYATNMKAYKNVTDSLSSTNSVFLFTIDELKYSKDSIHKKLLDATKELKIKDSKIQSLQYYHEVITKVDTILLKDTIFVKDLYLDTTISDPYYSLELTLQYPNKVIASPMFVNDKSIIVSEKKETVNPPKKLWICRLFQKKHIVLTIDVFDKNPYVNTDQVRFIQIIK